MKIKRINQTIQKSLIQKKLTEILELFTQEIYIFISYLLT